MVRTAEEMGIIAKEANRRKYERRRERLLAASRERRATDPDFAEAARARVRAYRERKRAERDAAATDGAAPGSE